MDDLIIRQAAIDAFVKRTHLTWEHLKNIYPMLDALEELPSAERHGRWIFEPNDAIELMFTNPRCSLCDYESADHLNYCPNCGARMDLDEVTE